MPGTLSSRGTFKFTLYAYMSLKRPVFRTKSKYQHRVQKAGVGGGRERCTEERRGDKEEKIQRRKQRKSIPSRGAKAALATCGATTKNHRARGCKRVRLFQSVCVCVSLCVSKCAASFFFFLPALFLFWLPILVAPLSAAGIVRGGFIQN